MRRVFICVFSFFLSGLLIYHTGSYILIGAVITALFLIFFIKNLRNLAVYCLIFVLIGTAAAFLHNKEFERKYKYITGLKEYEGYVLDRVNDYYTVKNYSRGYKIDILIYKDSNILPGDYIIFKGAARERPDYKKKLLNSKNLNAYITWSGEDVKVIKKSNILLIPAKIKYRLDSAILSISKEGGSFICGLVTGYTGDISEDDKSGFSELGISHILAVSGFNLGIIYIACVLLTRKMPAKTKYAVTILLCFVYTAIGGFEPSISRAFAMVCVAVLAKMINRPYDVLNGITFTAFIMLLANSYYIFNLGFLLSFLATYGIILFKDDITDRLENKINFMREEIGISLAAFIATFPPIIWYKGFFSALTVFINVIISPAVSFLTVLSFGSAVLFLATGVKSFFYPAVFIAEIFIKIIRVVTQINIPLYIGQPSSVFIVSYYLFVFMCMGYISIKFLNKRKKQVNLILSLIIAFSLFYHKPYLKIHVLNVGQGDSIFIETPSRHTILLDTGPAFGDYASSRDKVVPYIKRQGYDRIDLLVISHFHNDHAGGLEYLYKDLKVGSMVCYTKPENINHSFISVSQGDSINVDDVIIKVLLPEGKGQSALDKNETCLINELRYKDFSMLFTGDADKEDMESISGKYDILKVPHHGSINSFSDKILDNITLGCAVISVGKNSFGHPSPYVIEGYEEKGIDIFRTDKQGDISIISEGYKYRILSQSP